MTITVGRRVKVCLEVSLRGHPVHNATGIVRRVADESAWVEFIPVVQVPSGGTYDGLWLGLSTLTPIGSRMPISPIFLQEVCDAK